MLNSIKKLFRAAEVSVKKKKEAVVLSEQELKAIAGAGQKIGTMGGGY